VTRHDGCTLVLWESPVLRARERGSCVGDNAETTTTTRDRVLFLLQGKEKLASFDTHTQNTNPSLLLCLIFEQREQYSSDTRKR
jgi:hypothetical protein